MKFHDIRIFYSIDFMGLILGFVLILIYVLFWDLGVYFDLKLANSLLRKPHTHTRACVCVLCLLGKHNTHTHAAAFLNSFELAREQGLRGKLQKASGFFNNVLFFKREKKTC